MSDLQQLSKIFMPRASRAALRDSWTSCFYRATRMLSADYAVARCLSVCPSVCHTPVLSLNGYTYHQSFFHHRIAHHSSFLAPNGMAIFRPPPPNGGVECKGYEQITIFDQYLASSRKWYKIEPYIYYGRRIGNRTQAFEWYRFEWSWVTSNPDFKVMILFNVK